MTNYVDMGQLITELEIQRDDALANLRLEQARTRYLAWKLDNLREVVARASSMLFEAGKESVHG